MAKLILNRIRTPDGTILTSYHRNDYVTHLDLNGARYAIDGGLDYLKRNLSLEYEELSVYDNASFEIVRLSFNIEIDNEFIPLKDVDSHSLRALISGENAQLAKNKIKLIKDELSCRN